MQISGLSTLSPTNLHDKIQSALTTALRQVVNISNLFFPKSSTAEATATQTEPLTAKATATQTESSTATATQTEPLTAKATATQTESSKAEPTQTPDPNIIKKREKLENEKIKIEMNIEKNNKEKGEMIISAMINQKPVSKEGWQALIELKSINEKHLKKIKKEELPTNKLEEPESRFTSLIL